MATRFILSGGYGVPRVMSSYEFSNYDQGPPANSDGTIKNVIFNSNMTCSNGWVCEHRWHAIRSMVKFAAVVRGTNLTNIMGNAVDNQISFCRGNRGFVAFNAEDFVLNNRSQTCLPAGIYCDVISGDVQDGKCTGKTVEVALNGTAHITIKTDEPDGFLAIHLESKIWSPPIPEVGPPSTIKPTPPTPFPTPVPGQVHPNSVRKSIHEKYFESEASWNETEVENNRHTYSNHREFKMEVNEEIDVDN